MDSKKTRKVTADYDADVLLLELNTLLVQVQENIEARLSSPEFPTIFIIGPPRSGTTLVSQVISSISGIGYISNFVARFWLAPSIGIKIEQALRLNSTRKTYCSSSFGRTEDWHEPHEFGYFWGRWFDQGQVTHNLSPVELEKIDRIKLQQAVASIESSWQCPIAFKNSTWCTMQAKYLAELFPKALFVVCRRDPLYVAQSIAIARKTITGNLNTWWSIRPSTYAHLLNLPWAEQVIRQALDIESEMDQELSHINKLRIINIAYNSFCENPKDAVGKIIDKLSGGGWDGPFGLETVPSFFVNQNKIRLPEDEWKLLNEAYLKYHL